MSKKLVLKDSHPFMQKVNELYNKMEELGIIIEYGGAGGLNIKDVNNNRFYRLEDRDDSSYMPNFPTGFEFKLVIYDYEI